MARVRVVLAATIASMGVGLAAGTPASGQAGSPSVSITPTSGPIGTEITAAVANCLAPSGGGEARLDFTFEGFTPANTEFFTPDAGGAATVTIEAIEKEGQSESLTAAEVAVSQCGNEGADSTPFSVTRSTGATTTTTSTSTSTTSTTTSQPPESVDSTSTQPPSAVMASPSSEVDGDLGSYCWTASDGSSALCVDKLPPDPGALPLLRVSRGAPLSVRFDTSASPTETQLLATAADGDEQRFEVAAANPARFSAGLDPGVYLLSLFTRWDSGDAVYFFRLQVDADGTVSTTSTTRVPPSNRQGQLPATGSDVGTLASAGAAMAGMGVVLLRVRLRLRTMRPQE